VGVGEPILKRVNEFHLQTRQSRARAERVFAEQRVTEASRRLRAAEESLRESLVRNRSVDESPNLRLDLERFQREVSFRQQIASTLEHSYENARMREVQDTPVITTLQSPQVLSVPDPRGLLRYTMLGGIVAAGLVLIVLTARLALSRPQRSGRTDAQEFYDALAELRSAPFGRVSSSV
jgi:uncharacterized protein involved in exopolysaccharide biosynthesis